MAGKFQISLGDRFVSDRTYSKNDGDILKGQGRWLEEILFVHHTK